MKRSVAVLALVGSLAVGARAEGPDEARRKVMARLDTTKISLDFSDTGLDEVVDFLREATGLNFVLSKEVQEKVRNGELKVDISLEDITLRSALKLVLGMHDLSMAYRKGVLVIETQDERGASVKMRIFDIKDLMMKIEDFPGPSLELVVEEEGGTVGIVEPEPGVFEHPDSIVNILRNATGGDAVWGQDGASISVENGLLIVVHNESVLKEVAELIVSLRQFK